MCCPKHLWLAIPLNLDFLSYQCMYVLWCKRAAGNVWKLGQVEARKDPSVDVSWGSKEQSYVDQSYHLSERKPRSTSFILSQEVGGHGQMPYSSFESVEDRNRGRDYLWCGEAKSKL